MTELEDILMEVLRAEVERAPTIDIKRPNCEICGTRRTPTFPCKHCWPEDWNERYRIARQAKRNPVIL